jgi:hypothetical protein
MHNLYNLCRFSIPFTTDWLKMRLYNTKLQLKNQDIPITRILFYDMPLVFLRPR